MGQANTKQEEIHLGDLLSYIGKGFRKIGRAVIRLSAFILRNFIILLVLIIIGVLLGHFMDRYSKATYQTEFLVGNYFNSGDYLKKKINEVDHALNSGSTELMRNLELDTLPGHFSLSTEPIIAEKEISREKEAYYRILSENSFVESEDLTEMFINNFDVQRVILQFPEGINGRQLLTKIMEYIRQNKYYQNLAEQRHQDVVNQISSNNFLIRQTDSLVKSLSTDLINNRTNPNNADESESKEENIFDLGAVMEQRLAIQKRNEQLLPQKVGGDQFLKILDRGMMKPATGRSFLSNKIIFYPIILIFMFLLVLLVINIFKQSVEYNRENHA